jgi:hypothetical protein
VHSHPLPLPSLTRAGVSMCVCAYVCLFVFIGRWQTSLEALMDVIRATQPHFIRCVKPNERKEPFAFDAVQVLQQVRTAEHQPRTPSPVSRPTCVPPVYACLCLRLCLSVCVRVVIWSAAHCCDARIRTLRMCVGGSCGHVACSRRSRSARQATHPARALRSFGTSKHSRPRGPHAYAFLCIYLCALA